jgi:hypothetical protein
MAKQRIPEIDRLRAEVRRLNMTLIKKDRQITELRQVGVRLSKPEFIDSLNDILAEAKIDEPAGQGCGYAIHYDEAAVLALLPQELFLEPRL